MTDTARLADATSAGPGPFTAAKMSLVEDDLAPFRHALYHSRGDGYCVFPRFLAPEAVTHIQRLWSTVDPVATHTLFPGKKFIHAGSPDYYTVDAFRNRTFFNFLWNAPLDEVAYTAAVWVQVLRNRLSGRPPFAELLPIGSNALDYRVVITRNATSWVAPHRDFLDHSQPLNKARHDLSRLQATLFLSEKGVDYAGTGFKLERNDGRIVVFGSDVSVAPGDLVIWRYNNLHSVEDVHSEPAQLGFIRMIFPTETIYPVSATDRGDSKAVKLLSHAKRALQFIGAR
jgi:hypothetical protein